MDKDMFKSYKFKPSDVIEGLNRYFAETKANRYRRVPLEIKNVICYPEEAVGVAIDWLREEHDIFYTPGMEAPVEDFDVDEAAKEYKKATRKDRIEELQESRRDLIEALQRRLYEAKRRIVALEGGHAEKTKIIDQQVAKIKELEEQLRVLRYEILKVYREIFDCSNGDPEGTDEETMNDILTEYQRVLKMKDDAETDNTKWRPYIADILGMDKGSDWSDICIRARVIKHDRDNLDICLKMLENHVKEAYSKVFQADADKHWFGHGCQAVTDIVEALKRERAIKEEAEEKAVKYKEWTKRMEQKLIEIQDICER